MQSIERRIILTVMVVCLIAFMLQEFMTTMPIRRTMIPFLPLLTPEYFLESWCGTSSNVFSALMERIEILGISCIMLFAAWSAGNPLVRFGLKNISLTRCESFFFSLSLGQILWSIILFLVSWLGILGARESWCNTCQILTEIVVLVGMYELFRLYRGQASSRFLKTSIEEGKGLYRNELNSSNIDEGKHRSAAPLLPDQQQITKERGINRLRNCVLILLAAAFAFLYLTGAMVPTCEYDMLEYHLESAREISLSGHLGFFSHNVYQNMPLGTEMFYLWGMELTGSPYGEGVGKIFVALISLVTALGCYSLTKRLTQRGWLGILAAIVYLAMPLNGYVFMNGLNDGAVGPALLGTIYLFCFMTRSFESDEPQVNEKDISGSVRLFVLLGLYMGFVISVKYTNVVFILLPVMMAVGIIWVSGKIFRTEQKRISVTIYGGMVGMFVMIITGGLWYVKNAVLTGNPFYPLTFQLFGDSTGTWTAAKNARWLTAHGNHGFSWEDLTNRMSDFLWSGDMASPVLLSLFVGLGLFVLFRFIQRQQTNRSDHIVIALIAYVAFYLVIWFFATHRLTRFLTPLFPVLSLLFVLLLDRYFPVGTKKKTFFWEVLFKKTGFAILVFGLVYSLVTLSFCQKDYLVPLDRIRTDSARYGDWSVWFRQNQPKPGEKILLLGDANAFAYPESILYSTCWDDSPLIPLLRKGVRYNREQTEVEEITRPEVIRRAMSQAGIRMILYNRAELKRFRSPGNYGYTHPEINDRLMNLLETSGVIEPFFPKEWEHFSDYTKANIAVWHVCVPAESGKNGK